VNEKFAPRLKKVVINALQRKETKQETEEVHHRVLQDRKYLVDAAIVRTMKARRRLTHAELTQEVIRILRFPLDIEVLRQRIASLIENDYMENDQTDTRFYLYVA